MLFRRVHLREIIEHARQEVPYEACGILAGAQDRVFQVYRADNVADQRQTRYLMDSHQQLKIMREVDARGWEILGIYHSHPFTIAYPSPTDVELAGFPEAIYFIVSLADDHNPLVRAFRIQDKEITEQNVEVVDE